MWQKMRMILISLTLTTTLVAESPVNFTTCTLEQQQLGLCQNLVKDLKNENELLGQKISTLTKQRDAAEAEAAKTSSPLLPTWAWVVLGAAVGGTAIAIIKK
jgi:hypothetical protein